WRAYNTDAPGMVDALGGATVRTVSLLGGGGTARAALGAAKEVGAERVTLYVRRPEAADELRPVADALGVPLAVAGWADAPGRACADLVISTVPSGVADVLAGVDWAARPVVFD